MSVNDHCTHPDHEAEWVACPACMARDSHYIKTRYYCNRCGQDMGGIDTPSKYPGTARAPHDFLCGSCWRKRNDERTAKPRGVGNVQFHRLEIIAPLHGGRVRDPIPRSSQGLAGRAGRDRARGAAARAKAAAHRLMHRVQNSYGIRQCVFCNLLTHNRFRPLSHSSK